MAQRPFAQLLLARVLLLNLFSRRLKTLQGGYEQEEHRRLWVLLQVQPDIFCNGDIFTDVSKHLRGAPIDDLRALIFVESRKNTPPCGQAFAIPQPSKIRLLHFSSVLDEVQITVSGPSGMDGWANVCQVTWKPSVLFCEKSGFRSVLRPILKGYALCSRERESIATPSMKRWHRVHARSTRTNPCTTLAPSTRPGIKPNL